MSKSEKVERLINLSQANYCKAITPFITNEVMDIQNTDMYLKRLKVAIKQRQRVLKMIHK